jgi:hypothetical protein
MQRPAQRVALLIGVTVFAITVMMPLPAFARHKKLHQLTHKVAHNQVTQRLPRKASLSHADFAVTYTGEAAKIAQSPGSGFWLNGGSVDGAVTFYGDLGLAANFSTVHSNDISDGTGLGKTSLVFGPRYTIDTTKWVDKCNVPKIKMKKTPPADVFAEALFGVAHGFDGQFPGSASLSSSANSSAIQLGIGADITLWRRFGVRLFELDYIRTGLPNSASNSQNDLRLSFGVTYRMELHPRAPAGMAVSPKQ